MLVSFIGPALSRDPYRVSVWVTCNVLRGVCPQIKKQIKYKNKHENTGNTALTKIPDYRGAHHEHRCGVGSSRRHTSAVPSLLTSPNMRPLSLSLACSAHPQAPWDGVSLGAQFRTHRPGRRLGIGMLAVSGYVRQKVVAQLCHALAVSGCVTQTVVATELGKRDRIRHGYGVKVGGGGST